MTDKQIIIDDCIHLDEWKHCDICEKLIKTKDGANGKKREHLLTEEDLRCDFYPNCYYKQLKRKEQECEELKRQLESTKGLVTVGNRQLAEALEENEDLKRTNKTYEQGIARLKDEKNNLKKENNSLKETIDGLLNIQYKLADNCVKYSQTLTEIKKLVEKEFCRHPECCEFCAISNDCLNQKIIVKINEVEDEG